MINGSSPNDRFKLKRIGSNVDLECSQIDLAHVIEPRVAEIFDLSSGRSEQDGLHW